MKKVLNYLKRILRINIRIDDVVKTTIVILSLHSYLIAASTNIDTTIYSFSEVDSLPRLITEQKIYECFELVQFVEGHFQYPSIDGTWEGWIIISGVIEVNGSLKHTEVEVNAITLPGLILDEVNRLIQLMDLWEPGMKNGEIVRTEILIPFQWRFR